MSLIDLVLLVWLLACLLPHPHLAWHPLPFFVLATWFSSSESSTLVSARWVYVFSGHVLRPFKAKYLEFGNSLLSFSECSSSGNLHFNDKFKSKGEWIQSISCASFSVPLGQSASPSGWIHLGCPADITVLFSGAPLSPFVLPSLESEDFLAFLGLLEISFACFRAKGKG